MVDRYVKIIRTLAWKFLITLKEQLMVSY